MNRINGSPDLQMMQAGTSFDLWSSLLTLGNSNKFDCTRLIAALNIYGMANSYATKCMI